MRNRTKRISILFTITSLLLGSLAWAGNVKITGTFSNMTYNKQGGDLTGYELRIILGRGHHVGIFQVTEGEPSEPIVAAIRWTDKSNGKFEMTITEPKDYEGKLTGVIEKNSLSFEYVHPNGAKEQAKLPRRKSYWD